MQQAPSCSTSFSDDRNVPEKYRVVEVELGDVCGMSISLTVRPHDNATDFGEIVRLADELRIRLGETDRLQSRSVPHLKRPGTDTGALFWSWAQPG